MARVNRAAFQPFRRCERSRISFFVSGNGAFLSDRPGEFMSRHGPSLPPSLPLAATQTRMFPPPPSAFPPPLVRFIGVAITRKFQFILPVRLPTFPRPLFSRNLYFHAVVFIAPPRFIILPIASHPKSIHVSPTAGEIIKIPRSEFFVSRSTMKFASGEKSVVFYDRDCQRKFHCERTSGSVAE